MVSMIQFYFSKHFFKS